MPFEDTVALLTTKLNFSYRDIKEMRLSILKVYVDKAIEIVEQEQIEQE